MFDYLVNIWNEYGFEICVGIAILFILFASLFRIGKKGTWSKSYFTPNKKSEKKIVRESKGEIECRKVLEELFSKPFKKCRPNFLKNPITSEMENDYNLELDCFNDELKLAVEYNGIQHYKYSPFFHKSKDSFHNQKYRDYLKRDLCLKNGIKLIEVPYTVKILDIKPYLYEKLSKL